jgi:hypothetical protein
MNRGAAGLTIGIGTMVVAACGGCGPSDGVAGLTARARIETREAVAAEAGESLGQVGAAAALIDLPLRTFVALELPRPGVGIPGTGMKHVTWAHNPRNNRLYAVGGDYSGTSFEDSYRQETWSLSLTERWRNRDNPAAGWQLEYPYCGPPGRVQPKHPDFVGWIWDDRRSLFWMVPGTMVPSDDLCPGETPERKDDPGFLLGRVMTFDPASRRWADQSRNGYSTGPDVAETWMTVYDPMKDELIRFGYNGGSGAVANILSLGNKRWSVVLLGRNAVGREIRINKEYLAPDLARRHIYAIDGIAGRLYRWNMDRRTLTDLGPVPGGGLGVENHTRPVWDSVNHVLLWHRADTDTFHVYHPASRRWATQAIVTSPPGLQLRARAAVFDPSYNVLLLMGGVEPPSPYMFLYRYGSGSREGGASGAASSPR